MNYFYYVNHKYFSYFINNFKYLTFLMDQNVVVMAIIIS